MYTEGFESLEEEKESRRTYAGSHDTEKILRENDKLKKSLEKEQFFNKLLDQEIQELKTSANNGRQDFHSEYWAGSRGISKGAFYLVLLVALTLAGYIGYGIYYNKPMNYLNIGKSSQPATVQNDVVTPPAASAVDAATTAPPAVKENSVAVTPPPAVAKDSVPNIIGEKKSTTNEKPKTTQNTAAAKKASVAAIADEQYNEEEVNAAIKGDADSAPAPVAQKPVDEKRAVIARYKVTSKANFYNNADENSMRGTFISGDLNKVVDALEEKNGFIFVVYTNDIGFTSKGWLSKTDLTKE